MRKSPPLTKLLLKICLLAFVPGCCWLSSCNQNGNKTPDTARETKDFFHSSVERLSQQLVTDSLEDIEFTHLQLDSILRYSDSTGNLRTRAYALYRKASLYESLLANADALASYQLAKNLAGIVHDQLLEALCNERLASIHLDTDDPRLALKLYLEALPVFEKYNFKPGLAKVYNILGVYYTETSLFDSAINYFNKALILNNQINNSLGRIHNKANLADMYERIGNADTSKYIYESILTELREKEDRFTLPIILLNLSYYYERREDRVTSVKYIDSALVLFEHNRDTALLAESYAHKAQIHLKQNQLMNAQHYARESVKMAHAIDSPIYEINAVETLIHIDSALGNYYSAFNHGQRLKILTDTLNQRKLRNHAKVTELEFQNSRFLAHIELQKKEAYNLKVRKNLYMILAILALVILLLSIIIFTNIRKIHKRKHDLALSDLRNKELQLKVAEQDAAFHKLMIEQTQLELQQKKHEEISNALELERKNRLLTDINKKIKSSDDSGKNPLPVSEIVSAISLQLNEKSDENSDLFNKKLTEVHPSFYQKLIGLHPSLTKSEIKFCGYLVVQLSGHQIAGILNITPGAIKKTRYRIRQKIGLTKSQSLDNYLLNLIKAIS